MWSWPDLGDAQDQTDKISWIDLFEPYNFCLNTFMIGSYPAKMKKWYRWSKTLHTYKGILKPVLPTKS